MITDRIKAISQVGFQEGFTKVAYACGLEPHQLIKLAGDLPARPMDSTSLLNIGGGALLGTVAPGLMGAGVGGVSNMVLEALTKDPEKRNLLRALGEGGLVGGGIGAGLGALAGGGVGATIDYAGRIPWENPYQVDAPSITLDAGLRGGAFGGVAGGVGGLLTNMIREDPEAARNLLLSDLATGAGIGAGVGGLGAGMLGAGMSTRHNEAYRG